MARFVLAIASLLTLAGCSGWLPSMDLRGAGRLNTAELRLDSLPPGAEARTSLGGACRTPCALPVTTGGNFSVTFLLDGFHPQTIDVRYRPAGDSRFDPSASETALFIPNPVIAELEPMPPPARTRRRTPPRQQQPPQSQLRR